jgi:hypothetical protein
MRSRSALLAARDVGVALCPLIALAVVRVWLGASGPVTASAAPDMAPPIAGLSNFKPVEVTLEQAGLLTRINELAAIETPDVFPNRVDLSALIPTLPRQIVAESEPEVIDTVQPAPLLVVTSIMDGRRPIAIIDGQARRVGDKVGPGWVIKSITDGKITIVHLDGRTKDCTIERMRP